MWKLWWFGGSGLFKVIGNIAIDKEHMTTNSTLVETMHLSCTIIELLSLISQHLKTLGDCDHANSTDSL